MLSQTVEQLTAVRSVYKDESPGNFLQREDILTGSNHPGKDRDSPFIFPLPQNPDRHHPLVLERVMQCKEKSLLKRVFPPVVKGFPAPRTDRLVIRTLLPAERAEEGRAHGFTSVAAPDGKIRFPVGAVVPRVFYHRECVQRQIRVFQRR